MNGKNAKKLRREIRTRTVGLPWEVCADFGQQDGVGNQRKLARGAPKRLYRLAKERLVGGR